MFDTPYYRLTIRDLEPMDFQATRIYNRNKNRIRKQNIKNLNNLGRIKR